LNRLPRSFALRVSHLLGGGLPALHVMSFSFMLSFLPFLTGGADASPLHVDLSKVSRPSPSPHTPIRIRLSLVPPPTPVHPEHLHVYLDGKMILMMTLTSSSTTLSLPRLAPGRHEVTVFEADPMTHKEHKDISRMSGMSMEGMDMGNMDEGGDTPKGGREGKPQTNLGGDGYIGHLILDVEKN